MALKELKETNTPGAAIAIVSENKIVYAKGLGLANIETRTPVSPEMLFRIGSITKVFTAVLLVGLAEERGIKLSEPIGNYVKGLNPKLARVTFQQLLSGTAGLVDGAPVYGPQEESALASTVRSWNDDIFLLEPGTLYSYSNPGYIVAGYAAEEIGGKPYAELMNRRVFRPLRMQSTTFSPAMAMTYPISQGHDSEDNTKPIVHRPFAESTSSWPAGFVFPNVYDLARFAIAFMNDGKLDGQQVLSRSVISQVSNPRAAIEGENPTGWPRHGKYGFGLVFQDYRGVSIVWHGGSIGGFGSFFAMAPKYHFAVIVLGNKTGRWLYETAEKAMELMLPLEPQAKVENKQSLPISESEKQEFVGRYLRPDIDGPVTADILLKDGRLWLRAFGFEQPITRIDLMTFSVTVPGYRGPWNFVLLPGADGDTEYLCLSFGVMKKVSHSK